MSYRPIPLRRFRRPGTGRLPGGRFGALTGIFDHWSPQSERGGPDNPNHIYLWVKVADGQFQGSYEAAVNVLSNTDPNAAIADLQYAIANDPGGNLPVQGFQQNELAYGDLGLTQADFTTVDTGVLRDFIISNATTCSLMTVYGHTYPDGTGLHDVHLNSGNPPGTFQNVDHEDGALVFYFDAAHGGPEARWLFLKFQTQTL